MRERYLDQRKTNYAKTTYENDSSVLWRFARATGDIQTRNVSHEHVDRWFLKIQTTIKEPSSLNNYRKRLNLFFLYAARAGWTRGGDPLINIKVSEGGATQAPPAPRRPATRPPRPSRNIAR